MRGRAPKAESLNDDAIIVDAWLTTCQETDLGIVEVGLQEWIYEPNDKGEMAPAYATSQVSRRKECFRGSVYAAAAYFYDVILDAVVDVPRGQEATYGKR